MRILLDECLPAGLGRELVGHEVNTVPKMGWSGLRNGELLSRAADADFDVFLTVDRKLPRQQKLATFALAVVVLRCSTNDIADLRKLMPELASRLPMAKKGAALLIG